MAGKQRTMVAYATKSGSTRQAAEIISRVLENKHKLDVDLVDIRNDKSPDISKYSNVVVGGGVRIGKVYEDVYGFLDSGLKGKRAALFIVCCEAGNPKSYKSAFDKYNTKIAKRYPEIRFLESEALGGCLKILGFRVQDVFDTNLVEKWAEKVGRSFSKAK